MKIRLSKIDNLSRCDHHYLEEKDECWYFGEYTAYESFCFSEMNQLIMNFKKELSRRKNPEEWKYKKRAICKVGQLFASFIKDTDLKDVVFVPIPPSKIKTDSDYDPRLVQSLEKAFKMSKVKPRISECIFQKHSTEPDHKSDKPKLEPGERADIYAVDSKKIPQNTKLAIIVDDVLTTGSHFKGVEIALKKHLPKVQVIGLFVARTVFLTKQIKRKQ